MAEVKKRGIALQWQMLIGFLVGLVLGLIANATAGDAKWVEAVTTYVTGPIGQIFLRLLFMLVIPLLVSALIVGIAEMGDVKALKRAGLKTLAFTVIVSGIAVVIALAVTNFFQPGAGVDPAQANALLDSARQGAGAILSGQADKPSGVGAVLAIIPNNIVAAMTNNDILAVMVFALIFGIAQTFVAISGFQTWQTIVRYGTRHIANGDWEAFGRLSLLGGLVDAAGAAAGCLLALVVFLGFAEALELNPSYVYTALAFVCAMLWARVSAPYGILRALDRFELSVFVGAITPAGRLIAAIIIWMTGPTVGRFLFAWAAV